MNPTAEEFYAQRDDRTNRIAGNTRYQEVAVRLSIESGWALTYPGQVAFLTAANILARWCRRVELEAPDVELVSQLQTGETRLISRALAEMKSADPFGFFGNGDSGTVALHLHLGPHGPRGHNIRHAVGRGWEAIVSEDPVSIGSADFSNPIGAMAAACLGVAAVFLQALGKHVPWTMPASLNLFGFTKPANGSTGQLFPKYVDLGNTLMVGAGAVGGCILYFLRMLQASGNIAVVDHDLVKILNLNRSLLLGIKDVGTQKALVAEAYFQGHPLQVKGFPLKYGEYLEQVEGRGMDLIIPVANEFGVRWDLANNYPPLMIYGSTGTDWSVHLGRHIPFQEDCLACRFQRTTQAPVMACATGVLELESGEKPDAALPFLSPLAALLAVAEIVKMQLPGYPFHPNRLAINIASNPGQAFPAITESQLSCGACQSRRYDIFKALRGNTLWAGLSSRGVST